LPRGHGLEIGAGAERATGTGEDGDGQAVVVVEPAEGQRQLLGVLAVDGVAPLGPVDGDDDDRAVGLDADGHGPP